MGDDEPRPYFFSHAGKQLAAAVVVKGDEPDTFTVKLQPAAAVSGRLLNDDGEPLADTAQEFDSGPWGAGTLLYRVPDPERFGVAELDSDGAVVGFEEKPAKPKSDLIPIGVYFLRPDAFDVIEHLAPSGRGELEITDVLNHYIPGRRLFTRVYDGHWTDAGTVPSLLRAAELAAEDDAAGRLAPPTQRPLQRRTDEVELPPRVDA